MRKGRRPTASKSMKMRELIKELVQYGKYTSPTLISDIIYKRHKIYISRQTVAKIIREIVNNDEELCVTPKSEKSVFEYLKSEGLEPEKTSPHIYGKGVPDFKCNNNTWVEVKSSRDGFSYEQLAYIKKLVNSGDKVFIIYNFRNKFVKFSLNFLNL